MEAPILLVVLIIAVGVGAQWIAWRVRLPAIILLAAAGLLAVAPFDLPRLATISVDGAVVAFTAGVAALVGLAVGLVPTAHAFRLRLVSRLVSGERTRSGSAGHARLRDGLVVLQLAVTLVIGLVANVFASFFLSKFLFEWVLGKRHVEKLSEFIRNHLGAALASEAIKARRKAQEADLVVVNHHLLLADLAMKEEGFVEFLPGAEAIILDEAQNTTTEQMKMFLTRLGFGSTAVTVTVSDGISQTARTFQVTVDPVNDRPVNFTPGLPETTIATGADTVLETYAIDLDGDGFFANFPGDLFGAR